MAYQAEAERDSLTPVEWLMPRTYVSQILCFGVTDQHIFGILKEGLHGLVQDVPYLLSGVVSQEAPKGSVRLTDPYQTVKDLFSFHDLSATLNYETLKADHFPPKALTSHAIRPPGTTPPYATLTPVFRARLSLADGGLLLCIAVHHSTTDVTGLGALLKLWAAHCRSGSSAAVGFDPSWFDRSILLGSSTGSVGPAPDIPEFIHLLEKGEQPRLAIAPLEDTVYETEIWHFPQKLLHELKEVLNQHVVAMRLEVPWVSTGDVLAAILWSATTWAEQPEGGTASCARERCATGIPVNFRSRIHPRLPTDYLGAAFGMTTAFADRADLLSASASISPGEDVPRTDHVLSLARVASAIRVSLGGINDDSVRNVLQYTVSRPDITSIKLGPRHDGISLVSWADEGVYELDWGDSIGRCEAVRLPKMGARRYPIILPRIPPTGDNEPGHEVIASFDERTMERFCQNPLIRQFGNLRSKDKRR
jgi:trichothecene 3-O-acetyltransferase